MRTEFDMIQLRARKKRTEISAVMILVLIPLVIFGGIYFWEGRNYLAVSLIVLLCTMAPFFMVFEKRRPKAREIVAIAMMAALTGTVNTFSHIITPFQPGTALVIIAGIAFGPEAGFLSGALARLSSNAFIGQGAWTPWQMFCWGIIGFLAGFIFNKVDINSKKVRSFQLVQGPVLCIIVAVATALAAEQWPAGLTDMRLKIFLGALAVIAAIIAFLTVKAVKSRDIHSLIGVAVVLILSSAAALLVGDIQVSGTFLGWKLYAFGALGLIVGLIVQRKRLPADDLTLAVFGFLVTFVIYGGIMNIAAMVMASYIPASGVSLSFESLALLYISGAPYDATHAAGTAFFIFLFGEKMIVKLERVKIKYGFYR